MRERRWGPFRQIWLGLCPRHLNYKNNCDLCKAGEWHNAWVRAIDHVIYNRAYPIWYWWHNRPNSRTNRFLRQHFPNIR